MGVLSRNIVHERWDEFVEAGTDLKLWLLYTLSMNPSSSVTDVQ